MQTFKVSRQMAKAIMMAFQKSIMDQDDILEIFEGFEVVDTEDGLVVMNPPVLKVNTVKSEE
jgi:hypothetical protein